MAAKNRYPYLILYGAGELGSLDAGGFCVAGRDTVWTTADDDGAGAAGGAAAFLGAHSANALGSLGAGGFCVAGRGAVWATADGASAGAGGAAALLGAVAFALVARLAKAVAAFAIVVALTAALSSLFESAADFALASASALAALVSCSRARNPCRPRRTPPAALRRSGCLELDRSKTSETPQLLALAIGIFARAEF